MNQKTLTTLERYLLRRFDLETALRAEPVDLTVLWKYQEVMYRISVIETCRAFQETIPASDEIVTLLPHFQMLMAFFQHLVSERRLGIPDDIKTRRHRDSAHMSLVRIMDDHSSRLMHYTPEGPEQYRLDVRNIISTVLSAWMQYRDSLLPIKLCDKETSP